MYRVAHSGAPLEAGTYDWQFFMIAPTHVYATSFEIMDDEAYERIAAELETLQADLEAEGADAETIVLARAAYFIQQELASDALQELFSVSNPSEEMLEGQAELVQIFCPQEKTGKRSN
ncbi:MAG: hypothetical protein ICV77_11210 [Cyanobacteria bacterium Co-bin8]|nr:hypothetical protein [Cyanobacteria bacterium Co-bin8]